MKMFNYTGSDGCRLAAWKTDPVDGPVTVLLHGGGPDHQSLVPLADKISDLTSVVVPDIRGYGRSVCKDPKRHTWKQYTDDVITLLEHLNIDKVVVGGTGLGATLSLRFAAEYPGRTEAIIPISIEEIEDDDEKRAEIEFMNAFAERVRSGGIMAGWDPILKDLAPVIRTLVEEAIPRSDPESIAAAAAIGYDRSFRTVEGLKKITAPALIIPGMDRRHPAEMAKQIAEVLPNGQLAEVQMHRDLLTAEDLARVFAPEIRKFITELNRT
ncbi:MAG: alpha/beta hydrolase [Balneolaceae bacterium]|nr:alpha/beta hydrolase [Balneolaceae bacterium]